MPEPSGLAVKDGLKIFSYFGGDCPVVVVCCGRGVLFGSDARDNFDARTHLDTRDARINFDARRPRCLRSIWRHRLARIFVQVHDRLPRERPLLFFRVFAADLLPPPICLANDPSCPFSVRSLLRSNAFRTRFCSF